MRGNVNAVRIEPELNRVVREFRGMKNGRGHGTMMETRARPVMSMGKARIQENKGSAGIGCPVPAAARKANYARLPTIANSATTMIIIR